MKRFLFPLVIALLAGGGISRADDQSNAAAVAAAAAKVEAEEKFNSLKGKVDELIEVRNLRDRDVQEKLQQLARDLADLRQQMNKPRPIYATPEDIKRLAEAIQEVDRKRVMDGERFANELKEMFKKLLAASVPPPRPAPIIIHEPAPAAPPVKEPDKDNKVKDPDPTPVKETGFEYVVKSGDNFVKISKAYSARGIKVTPEQIQKANPGVKSERLIIGKKLWIPSGPAAAGDVKE